MTAYRWVGEDGWEAQVDRISPRKQGTVLWVMICIHLLLVSVFWLCFNIEKKSLQNLEVKKINDEKKSAMAAQFAAEATLRRVHAAQKDDDMPPIEAILAPLEAELKLSRQEVILHISYSLLFLCLSRWISLAAHNYLHPPMRLNISIIRTFH